MLPQPPPAYLDHAAPSSPLDELLLACHREEGVAQQRLYQRFYARALSVALHYSADYGEAEEVVHDAFLKLFRALAAAPFAGNFTAYLRSIVVHAGIDRYRVRSRRERLLQRILPRTQEVTHNEALRTLGEADVIRVLQTLSPGYRLVFNLYVVEGYSHPEIAERLGISVSTSKSNLAKARRVLEKKIGAYFPPHNTATNE